MNKEYAAKCIAESIEFLDAEYIKHVQNPQIRNYIDDSYDNADLEDAFTTLLFFSTVIYQKRLDSDTYNSAMTQAMIMRKTDYIGIQMANHGSVNIREGKLVGAFYFKKSMIPADIYHYIKRFDVPNLQLDYTDSDHWVYLYRSDVPEQYIYDMIEIDPSVLGTGTMTKRIATLDKIQIELEYNCPEKTYDISDLVGG